jgi:hypothetical protein
VAFSPTFWPRSPCPSAHPERQVISVDELVDSFAALNIGETLKSQRRPACQTLPVQTSIRYCAPLSLPPHKTCYPRTFRIIPGSITTHPAFQSYSRLQTFLPSDTAIKGKRKADAMMNEREASFSQAIPHRGASSSTALVMSALTPIECDMQSNAFDDGLPSARTAKLPSGEIVVDLQERPCKRARPEPLQDPASESSEQPSPLLVSEEVPAHKTHHLNPRKTVAFPERRYAMRPSSYPAYRSSYSSDASASSPGLSPNGSPSPTHNLAALPMTPQCSADPVPAVSPTLSSFSHWSQADWRSIMLAASHQPHDLDFLATVAQTEQQASAKAGLFDLHRLRSSTQPSVGIVQ